MLELDVDKDANGRLRPPHLPDRNGTPLNQPHPHSAIVPSAQSCRDCNHSAPGREERATRGTRIPQRISNAVGVESNSHPALQHHPNRPKGALMAGSCPAACQHAARAIDILTAAVTPCHGHAQLDAERVTKGVQFGT